MTAAAWIGDHWNYVAPVEPEREATDGQIFVVDWTRRRLLPCGIARSNLRCLHGDLLTAWCRDCETDLDAVTADMIP